MMKILSLISLISVFSCMGMQAPREDQAIDGQPLKDREFISLAEAIMTGSCRAEANQLHFTDFQLSSEKPSFYQCPIICANQEIYAALRLIGKKISLDELKLPSNANHPIAIAKVLSMKLYKDPKASITDAEVRAMQTMRLHFFMCGFDLQFEKERAINKIDECADFSTWKKEEQKKEIEEEYHTIIMNRALYKGALASQNLSAINEERVKKLRGQSFVTISEYLEEKRTIAVHTRKKLENPIGECQRNIQ